MVLFFIVPAILTVVLSFTGLDYRFQWEFIGLANYIRVFFEDYLVPRILLNTTVYVIGTLSLFNVGLALVLSILTSSIKKSVGTTFRVFWLLPRFTPPIVYGSIWLWILSPLESGLLNGLRSLLGFGEPISWISNFPWGVIIVTNGIIGASMGMVVFTSAIESISQEYRWAARVDGASWVQEVRYVILPMIKWPLMFITAYQTLSLLTSYQYILIITKGGPNFASEVWSLYAYDVAFSSYSGTYEFGYAAALASILVLIGSVASVIYWRVFNFEEMMEEPKIEVT